MPLVAASFLLVAMNSFPSGALHAQAPGNCSYRVLSVTPQEVVVQIAPQYQSQRVYDTSGYTYTAMTFPGGVMPDSAGAQGIPKLHLQFLTPSTEPASVEIVSQALEVIPNIDLAPVPTYRSKPDGSLLERYIVVDGRYYSSTPTTLFTAEPVRIFRTAYAEQLTVSPIQYDPSTRSVTRVKSLVLRIRFPQAGSAPSSGVTISREEASTFRAVFLNGAIPNLYSCAWQQGAGFWARAKSSPLAEPLSASTDTGQWILVTTGAEGIYRITAQDLANAGVTGPINPNSIELLGQGGEMLPESVTDSSGEWIERPIEVHANGPTFSDFYFYAPGITAWKYSSYNTVTDGLYRSINPYTSSGHFLLHVGGVPVSAPARIIVQADSLSTPAIPSSTVFTSVIHEVDHTLEYADWGREMLDQPIPIVDQSGQGAPPLQLSLGAPGYAPDSSTLLIAWDSQIGTSNGSPATGYLNVTVNGQSMGTLGALVNTGNYIDRNWSSPILLAPSTQMPVNLSLTFTSSIVANAILDFVELFYHRTTDIGSQSIPFFLVDTNGAFEYQFTNAIGGEVWDVTNSLFPKVVANANGNSMTAEVQGKTRAMRRFIAFSGQSLLSPTLSLTTAPTLRNTLCQKGATEIIVAPQAFLSQANELAALREEGGEATEAMSAAVVTIEQIYQEFGYGNNDIVALRDFMAYTFRHAQTRPVYLTLLGGGHCDYQNRETNAPDWLPPYEDVTGIPFPDDGFFVRLTHNNPPNFYDLAVGRISARNADDAQAYVQKVQEYEHSSDTGSWRTLATFLADDHWDPEDPPYGEDLLDHFYDTQLEITHLQDRVLVHKIYEASYPTVISSSGGHTKPAVNQAIIDAFNNGTFLFSFIGHGNPNVWTHEGVLNVPTSINEMSNFNRLAYVTTATCDFSEYDDFNVFSGGEVFLMKPDGGAIGLLGTSRSVGGGEPLVQYFYQTLFQQDSGKGTSTVGQALINGKMNGEDYAYFYLLGDPAQRLLLPKEYVNFDSLNGQPMGSSSIPIPALSTVQLSGSIHDASTDGPPDGSFNGTVEVTLYDTPTQEIATSTFPDKTIYDVYNIEGPILFKGIATVTNGRFTINFVVPRDVKLDTGAAKFSGYAYSSSDGRTALGDNRGIQLVGSDSASNIVDTTGPALQVWLGSRMFRSGDAVSRNSTAIVDVSDIHGLNTSSASIGHSFIAWVDNAMDSAVDMASTYVSKPNDFTSGTSIHAISLPAGYHTLHVRAFDTYDNPTFASVDFYAKNDAPYELYNVSAVPNPLQDHTTFSFVQPGSAGGLVNVTLSLYASDGALIRVLTASSRASSIEIPWDGRDATGTSVADGAYFFSINAQDVTDGTSTLASGKCIVKR